MQLVGIPKEGKAICVDGLRYIGLLPTLQKFYIRCVGAPYARLSAAIPSTWTESRRKPSLVNTLGFSGGRSCEDIIGLARELYFYAHEWGETLWTVAFDILAAFDHIHHSDLLHCLVLSRPGVGAGSSGFEGTSVKRQQPKWRELSAVNQSLTFVVVCREVLVRPRTSTAS